MREPHVSYSYAPHTMCGGEVRNTVRSMPRPSPPTGVKTVTTPADFALTADEQLAIDSPEDVSLKARQLRNKAHHKQMSLSIWWAKLSPAEEAQYVSRDTGKMSVTAWRECQKFRQTMKDSGQWEAPLPPVIEKKVKDVPVIPHPAVLPEPRFMTWPGRRPVY